jgi:cell fate (sporulation/competence/biofilm development) regulator YmcA (YheA/YmcA/DUF963 family)
MDQNVFNIIIGVAAFFGSWILNNITKAIDRLDKDVRNLPVMYVAKDDYHRDIDDVKNMLDKIFNKLENKVDK